jgi:hypothetical protein
VLSIVSDHWELAEKPHTLNIGQYGEEKAVGKKKSTHQHTNISAVLYPKRNEAFSKIERKLSHHTPGERRVATHLQEGTVCMSSFDELPLKIELFDFLIEISPVLNLVIYP